MGWREKLTLTGQVYVDRILDQLDSADRYVFEYYLNKIAAQELIAPTPRLPFFLIFDHKTEAVRKTYSEETVKIAIEEGWTVKEVNDIHHFISKAELEAFDDDIPF